MNLAQECIEKNVKRVPHRTALINGDTGQTYSYAELDARINAMANGLLALGVRRGDRVALYLPNVPEFIIAFFANAKIGAISVSVNIMFKQLELEYILGNSGAKCIVGDTQQLCDHVLPIAAKLPDLEHLIGVGAGDAGDGLPITEFDALLAGRSATFAAVDLDSQAPLSLLYTSGTTGRPKGALASHRNWGSMAALHAHQVVLMTDEDIVLSGYPFFHVALVIAVLPTLYVGGAVLTLKRFLPKDALRVMTAYRATHFMGTPTMWAYLIDEYENASNAYDLTSLWQGQSAGASLPAELCKRIQDCFGIGLVECYGATECSSTVTHTRFGHPTPGSAGWATPGWAIKIIDDAGVRLPNGEVGVLCCKGPGVVSEYWNDPEMTAARIKDGWWWSGDLAYIESGGQTDGQLYIVDRKDDMIVCGGYNIYPAEVEGYLAQHPAVLQAFVIGIADAVKGQIPKAFVVAEQGVIATEQEIIAFSKSVMAAYKAPRQVQFVALDDLPQTASGKILKRKLRAMEEER